MKKWHCFGNKILFPRKKSWRMTCNSNNFQHRKNPTYVGYVDNSILQIPLKFRVYQIKNFRVLLLVDLKNAVLRKKRLIIKVCLSVFWGVRCGKLWLKKKKYFQVPDLFYFFFEYLNYILRKNLVDFFEVLYRCYLSIQNKNIKMYTITLHPPHLLLDCRVPYTQTRGTERANFSPPRCNSSFHGDSYASRRSIRARHRNTSPSSIRAFRSCLRGRFSQSHTSTN